MAFSWTDFLHLTFTQHAWLWSGVALVALAILVRQPRTLVISTDDKGRLEISRHALHRLVETCCEQLKGVVSARACISRRKGKFETVIRLRIRPNAKLDAIQGYLTQEVGDIYRQNLGIDAVGKVEIKVVGVSPESTGF
ncbi:MAG TPA: hypothetical protein VL357_07805 [Rariglobus sp.]|jgi:hypothetical protein|nr:hypothetical protein [Rariglobus sp.]